MNYAWVEASILLFIAETFVELFGLFVLVSPVTDSECCKLLYNWEKCRVPVVIIINMFQFMA